MRITKSIVVLAVMLIATGAVFAGGAVDQSYRVFLHSGQAEVDFPALLCQGFDVLRGTLTGDGFELIVSVREYELLLERGFEVEILDKGRPYRELQAEILADTDDVPALYPDYDSILAQLAQFAADYPSIASLVDLTDHYGLPGTYEGNHIYAMKISDNVNLEEDEPSFLMVSCHHAREIVTPVIALHSIEQLLTGYGQSPEITGLVDGNEIWISPVWNPDGYEYVFDVNYYWRKNRQPCGLDVGVDLNRNYPFGWDSVCSGSTYTYMETYKGPSAASEVETQTMIAFHDDQDFAKLIDYHSYGRVVLYEYACHDHPFVSYLLDEAVEISTQAGYAGYVRGPSAEGEHYEWQLANNGTYAFLMETSYAFQPAYVEAVDEAEQVWPATVWVLQREIPITGVVTDFASGNPLEANITIHDVVFPNGEFFRSEAPFGRYNLFVPEGTYEIEFTRDGYDTAIRSVTVSAGIGEILDVALTSGAPQNEPPEPPSISGPNTGKPKVAYTFSFESSDPEGDDVYYYIDWGDGNQEDWIGPHSSGEAVQLSHTWKRQGTYVIQARTMDIHDAESDWSEASIKLTNKKKQ